MTAIGSTLILAWEFSSEADARFRRILSYNLAGFLLLSLVVPFLPIRETGTEQVPDEPPRLARLILEVKPSPPPPPPAKQTVTRPEPEPKPMPKSNPQPETRPRPVQAKAENPQPVKPQPRPGKRVVPAPVKKTLTARQQAEQSGLLALRETLSDLHRDNAASDINRTQDLSQGGGRARTSQRALLTSGTSTSSGGIRTAGLSRDTGGAALAERATTQVHSPLRDNAGNGGGNSGRGVHAAGRSIEEIQMVFDRNKGAIYSIYNRALRQDPSLQGKLVLRLTIAPSGKVIRCEVVSSELHDAALGRKVSQRVKLFDFGSRDVSEVTLNYPIDFLPT